MLAELDPEDRANYEKKRELLKRINQSQEKVMFNDAMRCASMHGSFSVINFPFRLVVDLGR